MCVHLDIPLPDEDSVTELLKINLKGMNVDPSVDFSVLAKKLVGYSGADINIVSSTIPFRTFFFSRGTFLFEVCIIQNVLYKNNLFSRGVTNAFSFSNTFGTRSVEALPCGA